MEMFWLFQLPDQREVPWPRLLVPLLAAFLGCASSVPESGPRSVEIPDSESSREESTAPPTADALFERALEVSGGRTRLLGLAGFRAWGRVTSADGVSAKTEYLARAPNLVRTKVTVAPGHVIETGFDGAVAWIKDPVGVRIPGGPETSETLRRADLHAPAHYAKHFPERRTIGEAVFEGRTAWQVEVRTVSGKTEQHYFDPETGRRLGFSGPVIVQEKEFAAVESYRAWMNVGGFEIPSKVVIRTPSGEQTGVIEKLVLQPPARSVFNPPWEVRALQARSPR